MAGAAGQAPVIDLSDIPDAAPAPAKTITTPAISPTTPATAPAAKSSAGALDLSDIPDAAPDQTTKPATTAPKSTFDQILESSGLAGLAQFGAGAVRGAVSTVQGIASPIRKLTGMAPATPPPEETTTLGKFGRGAEQVAEYLPLAQTVTGGVKALNIAKTLTKAGAPALAARFAPLAAESAAQGATAYGLSKAQGNSDASATSTGIVSAASPVGGAVLDAFGPAILKNVRAAMGRILASGQSPKEITPQLARTTAQAAQDALELPLQRTWLTFRAATAKGRQAAGQSLEQGLKGEAGQVPVPIQPIIKTLDDLVAEHAVHVKRSLTPVTEFAGKELQPPYDLAETTKKIAYDQPLVNAVKELKSTLGKYGEEATAQQLHDIKNVWQEAVFPRKALNNPVSSTAELLTTAQKKARLVGSQAIGDALESKAPSISELDQATSHAINLDNMVRRLATKAEAEQPSATTRYMGRIAGGAIGSQIIPGATGHLVGGAIGALGVRLLESAFESPAWRTAIPIVKDRLAKAIMSGDADTMRRILTPIIAGIRPEKPAAAATAPAR